MKKKKRKAKIIKRRKIKNESQIDSHFCSLFYDNNSVGTCSIETPTFAHSINPITECW